MELKVFPNQAFFENLESHLPKIGCVYKDIEIRWKNSSINKLTHQNYSIDNMNYTIICVNICR
jgi:pterin-4a-carbinolamine dehydratase